MDLAAAQGAALRRPPARQRQHRRTVSAIALIDGVVSAIFDGVPASASRVL
jgi:hypothetical protein